MLMAFRYGLWTFGAPGAGLMPGIGAAILVVACLVSAKEVVVPDGELSDCRKLICYVIGLVLLLVAIPVFGMMAALGLLVLLLLLIAEQMKLPGALATAVVTVGLSWLLFERVLQVPLPKSMFW